MSVLSLWSRDEQSTSSQSGHAHTHLGLARTDEANLEHPNAEKHFIEITFEGQYETTALRLKFGRPLQQVRGSSVPDPYQSQAWPFSLDRQPCLQDGPPAVCWKKSQLLTMFRCAHTHTGPGKPGL